MFEKHFYLPKQSLVSCSEIESVKLAKQKQKAEAKRKATPVVGDMQPLMEALPELSDLTAGIKGRKPSKRYVSPSNVLCCFPSSCRLKHPPAQLVATGNTGLGPTGEQDLNYVSLFSMLLLLQEA